VSSRRSCMKFCQHLLHFAPWKDNFGSLHLSMGQLPVPLQHCLSLSGSSTGPSRFCRWSYSQRCPSFSGRFPASTFCEFASHRGCSAAPYFGRHGPPPPRSGSDDSHSQALPVRPCGTGRIHLETARDCILRIGVYAPLAMFGCATDTTVLLVLPGSRNSVPKSGWSGWCAGGSLGYRGICRNVVLS
jgi:hypothetical protein